MKLFAGISIAMFIFFGVWPPKFGKAQKNTHAEKKTVHIQLDSIQKSLDKDMHEVIHDRDSTNAANRSLTHKLNCKRKEPVRKETIVKIDTVYKRDTVFITKNFWGKKTISKP